MRNIKGLFVAMMAVALMASCNGNKGESELSTDLVTSPKSASQSSEKKAAIAFDKVEHDFGTILQGEVVTYSFHFTNTGSAPLLITSVSTSCGCTVGDYPRTPIDPGKDGVVKATYNSRGHHGVQTRTLKVVSNTIPNTTVLRLKATVQTPDQY